MDTAKDSTLISWHRLFGLYWTDLATVLPIIVEVEKDLSSKKQLLDVLILRRGKGDFSLRLPDGFDTLATHNLITFKSFQESLDDWTLKELTSHYVTYRKLTSPSWDNLMPEVEFRLYAVCSRFPHNLANTLEVQAVQPGVYQLQRGTDLIRVIVVKQLPKQEHNAMLHLFSGERDLVDYGREHFRQHSENTSGLLEKVLNRYAHEGVAMSYTMKDFQRDYTKGHLKDLTVQERLEGLSPDEVLKELPTEEVLKRLPPEEMEKYLEQLKKGTTARKRSKRK